MNARNWVVLNLFNGVSSCANFRRINFRRNPYLAQCGYQHLEDAQVLVHHAGRNFFYAECTESSRLAGSGEEWSVGVLQ